MLKPRYNSMRDLLEEHALLCRGMDAMHPKDRTLPGFYEKERQTQLAEHAQAHAEGQRKQQVLTEEAHRQAQVARPERAHMSRYSNHENALHSFKVLAGMIVEEVMPRDPGLLATTRSEAAYRADTQRKIPKRF